MLSVFGTKQDEACQDVPSKSLIIQCQLFNQILIIIILLIVIICYFLWSWDKLLWGVFAPSPDGGGRNNLEINLVEDKVHELITVGIIINNQDHLLHHYDWDYHHYHVHHPWKRLLVDVIIKYILQSVSDLHWNFNHYCDWCIHIDRIVKCWVLSCFCQRRLLCPLFALEAEEVALGGVANPSSSSLLDPWGALYLVSFPNCHECPCHWCLFCS